MIASELFNVLDRYVQKEINLEELEDWIVPRLPAFFALPLSPSSEFVAAIELGLSEMSSGSRTEDEFRTAMKDLLGQIDTIFVSVSPEEELRHASDESLGREDTIRVVDLQETGTRVVTSSANILSSMRITPSFEFRPSNLSLPAHH